MKKSLHLAMVILLITSTLVLAGPSDPVYFADVNLESAVADKLGVTPPVTEGQMETLSSLTASNMNISDITGLEYAINLTYLDLGWNQISDISAVSQSRCGASPAPNILVLWGSL